MSNVEYRMPCYPTFRRYSIFHIRVLPRSHSVQAIVLRTYDIGEADRYAVLLTRELGRISVNAKGARKIGSRLGASILPFRVVDAELKEWNAGWILAGVRVQEGLDYARFAQVESFTQASQMVELVLALTEDESPIPDIYDALLSALETCGSHKELPLAFTLQILFLLGLLPDAEEMKEDLELDEGQWLFLRASLHGAYSSLPDVQLTPLRMITRRYLDGQLRGPLKAQGMMFEG